MSLAEEYKKELLIADQTAGLIKSGDWVQYGESVQQPRDCDTILAKRKDELTEAKITTTIVASTLLAPDPILVGANHEQKKWWYGRHLGGFTRTIPQAEALTELLNEMNRSLDAAINIEIPNDVLMPRMTGRRVCRQCGATYHVKFNPARQPSQCDHCGGEQYQRSDDSEETVAKRLEVYQRQTQPLVVLLLASQVVKDYRWQSRCVTGLWKHLPEFRKGKKGARCCGRLFNHIKPVRRAGVPRTTRLFCFCGSWPILLLIILAFVRQMVYWVWLQWSDPHTQKR